MDTVETFDTVKVHVGIDVGQRRDPSAVVVAEIQHRGEERKEAYHYVARHIERLRLGTSYPDVVARLQQIDIGLREHAGMVEYYIDATGVGLPIVDMLERAGILPLTPVYLTGSDKATWEGRELHLGKALLVSRLQVLLQYGRIHLPRTPEAQALINELLSYEIRVSESGQDRYGAFKTGKHDDLATALGLACYEEPSALLMRWV